MREKERVVDEQRQQRRERNAELAELVRRVSEPRIDRRRFTKRALVMALSAPAIGSIFTTYRAGAAKQETTSENPITITVGGTPIAVAEEDIANATPGGILRYARAEDSNNLDPVTNDGNVNIWIFMNVYDQLVRVTRDGASLEPGLAERWEISEDGKTYTFFLRQGVTFSDGTPLKASDVVYSQVRAANDLAETWTFTLTALQRDANGPVTGITAKDDSTVEMRPA